MTDRANLARALNLALAACVEAMDAGAQVAYIDFEDQASGVVARLRALGASDVMKDRPGFVRQAAAGGKVIGELHLTSLEDGSVVVEVRPVDFADDDGGFSPSRRRVLAVLEGPDLPLSVREVGDRLADDGEGPPLKRTTIQEALEELAAQSLTDAERPGNGLPNRWWRTA